MILDKENEHFCFIRQREVTLLTSIPKSSIPIEIEEGNFPKPVEISARSRAWLKIEILEWMQTKLSQREKQTVKKKL